VRPGLARIYAASFCILIIAACGEEQRPTRETAAAPATIEDAGPLRIANQARGPAMQNVLAAFAAETGEEYSLLPADRAHASTSVDLYVAPSLGDLWAVAEADKLRPVFSAVIEGGISAALRDPESRWVALGAHPRIVAYNTGLVSGDELASIDSYASLRDEAWRGRLCLSSSALPGNRLLVAYLISRFGSREAEIIVRQWRGNLAIAETTDDSKLVAAIRDGRCAIGIADGRLLASTTSAPGVAVHFFHETGETLFDISAAGVSRHALHPERAVKLLEWLVSETPNALFAVDNAELPANAGSQPGANVVGWPNIVTNGPRLAALGFLFEDADRLIERAHYR